MRNTYKLEKKPIDFYTQGMLQNKFTFILQFKL